MTKSKFKLTFNLNPKKCVKLIKKYVVDQASAFMSNSLTRTKKTIKVRKCPSDTSSNNSTERRNSDDLTEDGEFIPMAARDSKWVGLTFYNPNFQSHEEVEGLEDIEQEIQVLDVDDEQELPIYTLFPGLREKLPANPSSDDSTTNITKLLVGQKPNFAHLKKSRKITPAKLSLPSLQETPNEEKAEEEHKNPGKTLAGLRSKFGGKAPSVTPDKNREFIKNLQRSGSFTSEREHYDEEDDSQSTAKGAKKKRKTKKRADMRNLEMDSSYSGLNQSMNRLAIKQKIPTCKQKVPVDKQKTGNLLKSPKRSNKQKNVKQQSSQGSLADDEGV